MVNAEGCSIDQLCPCESKWSNHGAYASCVAENSKDFAAAGFMTEEEKDAIIAEAAQSLCGKKK